MAIDAQRFDHAPIAPAILSIGSHTLLIGNVIPDATLAAMRAERGAIYEVKEQVAKMAGITSLTNIAPFVMGVAAYRLVPIRFFFSSTSMALFHRAAGKSGVACTLGRAGRGHPVHDPWHLSDSRTAEAHTDMRREVPVSRARRPSGTGDRYLTRRTRRPAITARFGA